jgi:uncharacterized protein YdbL (DUF1318 family)
MIERRLRRVGLALAATLAACVTVNIYFPAPEVRKAAEDIVVETWGDEHSNAAPERPDGRDGSSWFERLGPATAHAAEPDVNVSTAAIRALKASMSARANELKPFLRAGAVGVGRDGMLVVRSKDAVPLRDRATIRRLVDAENRDRASLYKEIARANDFGDERVADIQRIFAETWIEKAESGWPVQKADGSWTTR